SVPLVSSPGPILNTILLVREHAPAEIEELASEIQTLNQRLAAAHERKHVLEQLLAVVRDAEPHVARTTPAAITVVR
ncbi:MAG TPA: hypothetical protein VE967_00225, partial [Gemmatimonadaceae bacterium]|nr:hypothetical protein [Gemmatimonadaceae bacterium]